MITANGKPVMQGGITENRNAAWTAMLEVNTDEALSGLVTIDVDGELFIGTAVLGDVESDRWKGTVIGGRGGLYKILPAAWYVEPTVGTLLTAIAREAGEVLDPTIPVSVLTKRFERWSRMQGEAHLALRQIADQLGYQWRVTRAGTIYLGPETWLPVVAKTLTESYNPEERKLTIAYDGTSEAPIARPGMTLDGKRIERSALVLDSKSLRQDLYFDEEKGQGGELGRASKRIRELVFPKLYLRTFYPGKVIAVSGNEVTVLVDDKLVAGKWKGLSRVKMCFGMPGVTAIPLTGARVRVMFDAGDPSRPRAALWDAGAPVAEMKLGGSAATPVAIAALVAAQLTVLKAAIAAAPTTAGDGGSAFKASLLSALSTWPTTVAATIVKAV
ncbi:MAG TPA: hypothetical protein VK509_01965 [Polyangiales bacterium]|nr:hypothetical protein [Polyangiales bacterium]